VATCCVQYRLKEMSSIRRLFDMTTSEHAPDPCPIHNCDDAVAWIVQNKCTLHGFGRVICVTHRPTDESVRRLVGYGGFDERGTVLMAVRTLWEQVNATGQI
jgi:hypothetical protein